VLLPPQTLTLTLASNPWRCDCGLLMARDNNEVLDLDLLQCALPSKVCNNRNNTILTKDTIGPLGYRDDPDFYNFISDEYVKLRDHEFGRLVEDTLMTFTIFLFFFVGVYISMKVCSWPKPQSEGKVWIIDKEIPKWSFDKLGKQEVPYIKMDKTPIKS